MTSLSAAGRIATSAISVTQSQIAVTASNIANADTDGYTRKTVSTSTDASGGVTVTSIGSKVDQFLLADLSEATSAAAGASILADYTDQLQTLMGSTSSDSDTGTSLANLIADLESALSELSETPESTTLSATAVTALDELVSQIRSISSDVQELRSSADQQISSSVDAANDAITTIDELNEAIVAAKARGESTSDLEDQRNQALIELSEYLEVTSFTSSDGSLKVYTKQGQVLVDGKAHLLEFTASSSVGASIVYDGSGTGLSGITVDGNDITADLSDGSLAALVTLRDETLTDMQDMLDELASGLITALNTASPDLLTGTSASDIAVSSSVLEDPSLLASSTGSSTTAEALLEALTADASFDDTGRIKSGSYTFSSYATRILAIAVSDATAASTQLTTATSTLSEISDTMSSLYGVNVDEETARATELEQLYSAAAQVLTVINEMFEDLLAAVS
jgi:flagellar hook-associated protein 1 FlgK